MSKEKGPKENNTKNDKPQNSERKIPDDFVFVKGDEKLGIDDFYICKHEVTGKEFNKVMKVKPYASYKIRENYNFPITYISILDAMYYCNKRSLLEGLEPVYMFGKNKQTNPEKWPYKPCLGKSTSASISTNEDANGYRLPLNIEWIYAARAGEKFKYSGSDNLDEVAWNACKKDSTGVHEVMLKKPNALGLYDMTGNVFEWCDRKKIYADEKIYKYPCLGGSALYYSCYIYDHAQESDYELDNQLRASEPDYREIDLGFRLVLSADGRTSKSEKKQPADDLLLIKPDNSKEKYKSLKTFYVCKHLVTNREFFEVMGYTPDSGKLNDNHIFPELPVWTWLISAMKYCNRRSLIEGLEPVYVFEGTNKKNLDDWNKKDSRDYFDGWKIVDVVQDEKADGYRLLYKEEISYIINEAKKEKLEEVGWFKENTKPVYKGYDPGRQPVMKKKPDSFGLYDIYGNVWELALSTNGISYAAGGDCLNSMYDDFSIEKITVQRYDVTYRGFRVARSFFE